MKKRILSLILACTMLVTVTACSDSGSDSESSKKTSQSSGTGSALFTGKLEKNVKIQVLENDTAISKGYFKELIDAFNKKYKD